MKKTTTTLRLICLSVWAAIAAGCTDNLVSNPLSAAKQAIEKHDFKAAAIHLKTALQKTPDSAETRFLLGKVLLERSEPGPALVEFRRAKELGHPEAEVLPSLVRALVLVGRAKEATDKYSSITLTDATATANLKVEIAIAWGIQTMDDKMMLAVGQALEVAPKHAPARVISARFKAGNGEQDEAWKIVQEVLAAEPKYAPAWHLQGLISRYGKSDVPAAMASQRKALELDPSLMAAHTELLSVLYQAKDKAGMRKQIAEMQKYLPLHLNTYLFRAQLEYLDDNINGARELVQQMLRAKSPDLRVLLLAAQIEFRNGALTVAETYLTRILQEQPGFVQARHMLASTYIRLGQSDKAIATLQPMIDGGAPTAESLGLAAEAHLYQGNLNRAQAFFDRAAKADPNDPRLKAVMAVNRISGGDLQQGFGDLEKVAEVDQGTFADMALISAHLKFKNFDAALRAVDRLEKKEPTKPRAATIRGQIFLAKMDLPAARANYEKASKIDPAFFPAAAALATFDVNDKKIPAAKKRFEQLLAKDSTNYRAILALADLKKRGGESLEQVMTLLSAAVKRNPTELQLRIAIVELHLSTKAYKSAINSAQDGLAAIVDNPELLDALGRAQYAAKEYQQAISSFRKVATLLPKAVHPHLRLADVYAARGEPVAATQSLQRALEITPNLLEAQVRQHALALGAKEYKSAVAVAKNVQQARPKEGIGFVLEADVQRAQKNWEASIGLLRSALSRTPSTEAAIKLHSDLTQIGKKTDADQLAAGWRTAHPKDAVFVLHLGAAAIKANDWAGAETHYRSVIALNPGSVSANNNLAWALMNQGKPGALAFAEKAIESAPNRAEIMDTLGAALADAGQTSKALELQKKVIQLDPTYLGARLTLARIAIKAGDKALAKSELGRLAYEGDKFPEQAEVAKLMKTLQ